MSKDTKKKKAQDSLKMHKGGHKRKGSKQTHLEKKTKPIKINSKKK